MAAVHAAGNPTTSGKRPAGTVLLEHPIQSFSIPTVNAECVMDQTMDAVAYLPPEEVDIIDGETGETVQTYRVPVMEDKKFKGYIPLPKRYHAVWLELSYYIVLSTNIWRLWAKEEEEARRQAKKEKAGILRRTTGTQVAQHMLARLCVVEELVSWSYETDSSGQERVAALDEWKIRTSRDWFNISYDKVPRGDHKFLNADPIRPENQVLFEENWNIDDEGKGLLSPPEDLAEWFHGEVDGLEEAFQDTLKHQALAALKSEDSYSQIQYRPKAKLPTRWHEGQQPRPSFWSLKHWNWVAQGNSPWDKPIDFLYCVLTEDPPYTDLEEFVGDLDALFVIVAGNHDVLKIHALAKQLWLGEMTWREFVDDLMENHLQGGQAVSTTSEKKDPNNVFDTLEARLVLEGYVRRNPDQPWHQRDVVLLSALKRVADLKYKPGWLWIIEELALGKQVTEVLKAVGPRWKIYEAQKMGQKGAHARAPENHKGPSEPHMETREDNDVLAEEPDPHEESVSEGADAAGVQEDDALQSSSTPGELNNHADKTQEACSSENTAQAGAAAHEKHNVIPEERTAMELFLNYTQDWSLDKYEAAMKSSFSQEHAGSIQEYIEAIQALGPLTGPEAIGTMKFPFDQFLHRVTAIEARKEAARSRDLL